MGKLRKVKVPPLSAMGIEAFRVSKAWIRHGVIGMPWRVGYAAVNAVPFSKPLSMDNLGPAFGEGLLQLLDELGPVYGKACQVALSRISTELHASISQMRLDRVYGRWPELPFDQIEVILDEQVPQWRDELRVERLPLGVASIAQVHAATDQKGREWVIKVIKPKAKARLLSTVAALESLVARLKPFAMTLAMKRSMIELEQLCQGLRGELDLQREQQTIERMREKLGSKQQILRIPEVRAGLCSEDVIVLEKFSGHMLSDIVSHKVKIDISVRRKLAKQVLKELLVQVFEVGLFHADPHAGNLMLLDDGTIGLFDWGLSGELLETDRKHIAGLLRAVISLDFERLIDVLQQMAFDGGKEVSREKISKEMRKLQAVVEASRADKAVKKPSLQQMIEACLRSAERLSIPVPTGLLLMAKSLVTIEGLAKGIDPEVGMLRVATPVLFRAAKPSLVDLLRFGGNLSKVTRLWTGKKP